MKKKKGFGQFLLNGAAAVLCIYIVYVLMSQQPLIEAKKIQKEELEIALVESQKCELQLQTDISLADSRYYIERAAMEKLGMLKPGDRVFIDIRR
jgi:cell division protein FtsB